MTKNIHMTHIDEALYEGGNSAANETLAIIQRFINEQDQHITTKIDGAPAIFCGYDPKDRQFFVGTKSVFNKNPKLYKSNADIDKGEAGEKATKLKECLKHLSNIGIPYGTVLQGDLLWTEGDQTMTTHKRQRYVTVHPNTIVYGWKADSPMANKVRESKLGIAFHTTYKVDGDLQESRAFFGAKIGNLHSNDVIMFDCTYPNQVKMSESAKSDLVRLVKEADDCIKNFDSIVEVMNMIPKSHVGAGIKTFFNSCIRNGHYPDENFGFNAYMEHVTDYWNSKVIPEMKSELGATRKKAALKQLKHELNNIREDIEASFNFVHRIKECKDIILKSMNEAVLQESFIKTNEGYFDTPPEGYVVAGYTTALKMVDRLNFSRFNFSEEYHKGWKK